ncbi:uncharacterized protein TrAFT101_002736 [Trichoderma asperellum]|uniref:uncharacterized protein n=1 Tax=Trichoderma asperellum TaxID=101201 RepID=UPI0033300C92|nr:hypothetical protein TrAFT101_002736 [Trichoderma asperellum]
MSSPSVLGANSMAAQLVGSTLVQRGRSWRDGLAKRNHAYLVPDFGLQQLRDAGPRPKDPLWRSSEKRIKLMPPTDPHMPTYKLQT